MGDVLEEVMEGVDLRIVFYSLGRRPFHRVLAVIIDVIGDVPRVNHAVAIQEHLGSGGVHVLVS